MAMESGLRLQHEQITFLCILFAIIVIGNVLVITAICASPNHQSTMNMYIINLAVADLSAGLVNVLTDILWKISIEWHAGNVGCKLVRYSQAAVTYASTYALVALSLDRLHVIVHPMGFAHSGRRFRILVGFGWSLALLFSVPMLVINESRLVNGHSQCWIEFKDAWMWKMYITLIAVGLFFMPAVIIAACYIIIVALIWKKTSTAQMGETGSSINSTKKPFIICWSPYFVFDLLDVYGFIELTQQSVAISTFIQSLAPLNSAANPIIYAAFNGSTCLHLLQCRLRRHRRQTSLRTQSNTYIQLSTTGRRSYPTKQQSSTSLPISN